MKRGNGMGVPTVCETHLKHWRTPYWIALVSAANGLGTMGGAMTTANDRSAAEMPDLCIMISKHNSEKRSKNRPGPPSRWPIFMADRLFFASPIMILPAK